MKSKRKTRARIELTGVPFLRRVVSLPESIEPTKYPFNIPAFSHGIDLTFRSNVTFFVGENGGGKSTLLEALAECCGFNPEAATGIITAPPSRSGLR
jgi:predicted ATPase